MGKIKRFLCNPFALDTLRALYAANFFIAFHLFLVIYVNSSYLSTFIPVNLVGLAYAAGSLGGILSLLLISQILERFGNAKTILTLTILEFFVFIGLAFSTHAVLAIAFFILYLTLYLPILFILDIFLESYTKKEGVTGSVRGAFLTTTNTALIISPLLAGFILGSESAYWRIFLTSAVFLIPFILILSKHLHNFEDPVHKPLKLRETFGCLKSNKPLYAIFKAHLIMRLFFVWMVIYTPIYLHEHIGFEWTTIGIVFTVMLLPFVLLELPAGKIADGWLGEKELLSIGFVITAFSVASMSFLTSTSPVVWMSILFITRIGAALLESMTEIHFFKHVDEDDVNTISFFRMVRPFAYIFGSVIGILALYFVDIQYTFLIFAIVILYGLRYSLSLKDTR